MKKVIIIVLSLILAAIVAVTTFFGVIGYYSYQSYAETVSAPAVSEDGTIVVMSANIRRQEKLWSTKSTDVGNHRWYKRAKYYLKNIELVKPDIFGAQEAQPGQYEFLTEHLVGYGSVVTYRDDRGSRSESCPIFYSEARFDLVGSGTYWLSETPDEMSISWKEGGEHRIVTYAKLKDKLTGKTVAVFNSHPDFEPDNVRKEEIKVIAAKAQAMLETVDEVIVFGDLNSDIHTTAGADSLASLGAFLTNAIAVKGDYGCTFNGYEIDPAEELDYFYVSAGVQITDLGKIDKTYDGVFPSDHFPIYMKVKLA